MLLQHSKFPLSATVRIDAKSRENIITALKKTIQDIQNGATRGDTDGSLFDCYFHVYENKPEQTDIDPVGGVSRRGGLS